MADTTVRASKSPRSGVLAAPVPPRSRLRNEEARSVEAIYERIYVAVLEHRLLPGTKLGEDRLAGIFNVSRARIRGVLARLAHEGIVDLYPQRGAHVASPTPEQALEIFEMRRLLEPGVIRRLVQTISPEKIARLREHHGREVDAKRRGDQRAVIRLSGEFHILLAELAGNQCIARSMRELSTLTCLIISLYDAPTREACREDEHAQIIDALAATDVPKARRLMEEHLTHIEQSLDLTVGGEEADLESIFAP